MEIVAEAATFDWNLLITALTGLGGVAVGGFVTWKIQERQLKHIDENRYQEQRMEAYIQMAASSNLVISHKYSGNEEGQKIHALDMIEALQKIQVISTEEVRKASVAVIEVTRAYTPDKGNDSDPGEEYKNTVSNFWQAVRKELKIKA